MFAAILRDDCPYGVRPEGKLVRKRLERRGLNRRTVDQGEQGGIPAAIENLLQSHLERAELSPLWSRIRHQNGSVRVNHRC